MKRARESQNVILESTPLPKNCSKEAAASRGIINFFPDRPNTEDDESIKIHIAQMKTMGSDPNPRAKKRSMDATFADRRLIARRQLVEEVKATYPLLFNQYEVSFECYRWMNVMTTVFTL